MKFMQNQILKIPLPLFSNASFSKNPEIGMMKSITYSLINERSKNNE
jgi:hypothetical protein